MGKCFVLAGRKGLYKPRGFLGRWAGLSRGPGAAFALASRGCCGEAEAGLALSVWARTQARPRAALTRKKGAWDTPDLGDLKR